MEPHLATPIIPWIGGKRRLADLLLSRFPAHSCYVELFAGGAALYFMRPPADVEIINDINGELVNLYRVVKHHLEEFVRQFKWVLSSRAVFKWLQDTPPETLTDIQRAARFYYLQHQAFGGKVSGQTWGTATTTPPVNLLRIEEDLSAAHLRLSSAYIEQLDWGECVQRYDRPHTLFYADPPYWQTEGYGGVPRQRPIVRLSIPSGAFRCFAMLLLPTATGSTRPWRASSSTEGSGALRCVARDFQSTQRPGTRRRRPSGGRGR